MAIAPDRPGGFAWMRCDPTSATCAELVEQAACCPLDLLFQRVEALHRLVILVSRFPHDLVVVFETGVHMSIDGTDIRQVGRNELAIRARGEAAGFQLLDRT